MTGVIPKRNRRLRGAIPTGAGEAAEEGAARSAAPPDGNKRQRATKLLGAGGGEATAPLLNS